MTGQCRGSGVILLRVFELGLHPRVRKTIKKSYVCQVMGEEFSPVRLSIDLPNPRSHLLNKFIIEGDVVATPPVELQHHGVSD